MPTRGSNRTPHVLSHHCFFRTLLFLIVGAVFFCVIVPALHAASPAPASASVIIHSPANGAKVTSPVEVSAAAMSTPTATLMQIYLDGKKVFEVKASSLDTSLTMSNGTHRLTVQAFNGTWFKTTENITVVSTSPGVSVSISPTSATIATGATQQFTDTVTGTGDTSVTWSVDGVAGGNATVGTISSSGLYTAPGSAGIHTVTVTSNADSTKSASAQVTVTSATGCKPTGGQRTVTICAPGKGAMLPAPVEVSAAANSSPKATLMQIYLDGKKVFETHASSLDTFLKMSNGSHRLTVQAFNGTTFKTTEFITVIAGATTTLQAETGNNTSASDSFPAQLNGLPKPANVSKVGTRSLLYSGSTTKIYAHLLGWFGSPDHMNVGYQSNDPQQVKRQVEDMQSRGIQGAILDWFGQSASQAIINSTAQALRAQAEAHSGFEFAIMEDGGALFDAAKANGCDVTTQLLSDLNFINTQFVASPAYTRVNGRPVILFFGVDAFFIDWAQVRAKVANNPLLLFRGIDGLTRPISDGAFQWEDISADPFHPASPDPFDPALGAQDAFYGTNPSGRLVIGSVYRGFNDTLATFGFDRFVHPRCGQTWIETFSEIGKFFSSSDQLPALQIVTWNDYEEGTAMEVGIDNCVFLQPSISGSTLSWNVAGGPETTIDHFTVFSTKDGQNLTKLADVPAGTHSLDLNPFNLTSGTVTLFVKATGRPSIQNKMSPAIAFHAGDQPPTVKLAVSQTGPLTFSVSTGSASSTIDFGDGTVLPGPIANHTYASVGAFDITATVVDNAGASAVAVQRVSAKATAPGVTIFSPPQSGVVNWPTPSFVASANGANPITQMNVLLDGTQIYAIDQDTVNTVLKIYSGSHHVEVQAVDSTGAVSSAAVNITAEPDDIPPVPAIQVTSLPQVGPNTVLLCGAGWQDPNRFVNAFQWTFPDGTKAFIPGVVHTFPSAGTFSTTELVINEFGSTGSITQNVTVSGAATVATPTVAVHVQDEQTQQQNLPIRLPQYGASQH